MTRLLFFEILVLLACSVAKAEIKILDYFEYEATRTGTGAEAFVDSGGWDVVNAINSDTGEGCGYIYTVTSIPGFTGQFPGKNSNRVAVFEFLPYTLNCDQGPGSCPNTEDRWLQTDLYLYYTGAHEIGDIPANSWFQFWVYLQDYGAQQSRFEEGKWLYPCAASGGGTCGGGDLDWLLLFQEWSSATYNENTSEGNTYMVTDAGGATCTIDCDWKATLMGHNQVALGGLFEANTWYLVKINFDMRNSSSGIWRMWLRKYDQASFTKVIDWEGGVTPGFTWTPTWTSGMRWLKWHTTVDCFDQFWYYDDFVLASSEEELPTYVPVQRRREK